MRCHNQSPACKGILYKRVQLRLVQDELCIPRSCRICASAGLHTYTHHLRQSFAVPVTFKTAHRLIKSSVSL